MTTTPSSVPDARAAGGTAPASAVRPASRYGDRTSGRRQWIVRVVVAVLAGAALTAWIWVAYARSDPPVRGQLTGYGDITDSSIDVRWSVVRDPGTAATCVIRARDSDGVEVGRASVEVTAGPESTVQMDYRLITLVRPFAAELLGCHLTG